MLKKLLIQAEDKMWNLLLPGSLGKAFAEATSAKTANSWWPQI